jgi:hypothetical protein
MKNKEKHTEVDDENDEVTAKIFNRDSARISFPPP